MNKKIAVLAGDGIGPEVMYQAIRVLECVALKFGHHFEFLPADIGGAAYEKFNVHCPDETLEICKNADSILFGSVGGPVHQQYWPKWKNCESNSILKLRQYFQFNINIRPIQIYKNLISLSPLKSTLIEDGLDFLIFRELNGDIYFGKHDLQEDSALDEATYTCAQIQSIAHVAFKSAVERQQRLVSVDKANVLATSKLWRQVVSDVAEEYPSVKLQHMLVDNAAMQLVINPQQFDVILTSNLFGDILSDLAGAVTGSLGLIPSASLNHRNFGLYEPSGGSAPDIVGQHVANPIAQILSAAMMLRHSFNLTEEAFAIEQAIQCVLLRGSRTKDIASSDERSLSTDRFTDEILHFLEVCQC